MTIKDYDITINTENCWKVGNNYYSKDKYKTYESAVEAEKTNTKCFNCRDCEGCINCWDCVNCTNCTTCKLCGKVENGNRRFSEINLKITMYI